MRMWIKTFLGLSIGILFGVYLNNISIFGYSVRYFISYTYIFGHIFIGLLKTIVYPLVISSLIVGICHIGDQNKMARIFTKTLSIYVATTIVSLCIGYLVGTIVEPGVCANVSLTHHSPLPSESNIPLYQAIEEFGENPFGVLKSGIFPLVIISSVFGLTLSSDVKKSEHVINWFKSILYAMHKLTHYIMKLAPIGIFSSIVYRLDSLGPGVLLPLFKFLFCNYLACAIQLFIVFPFIIKYISKLPIMPFFKGMKDAIVLAFGTASSSATLPVSLECATKHLGISEDISGFVISLGSTVNMNGTSIGQMTSALFIAQFYEIDLSIYQTIMIMVMSLISAIGASGSPGIGVVVLSATLSSAGLPLDGITILFGIDMLRELVSSVVNVTGDAVTALIVSKQEKELDIKTYKEATWEASI